MSPRRPPATPGWRFSADGLSVRLFPGPLVQDYRLIPDDPGSRLRGVYYGAQLAGEVWYQPSANIMAALNSTLASIGPTGSLSAALGYRLFDAAFVGQESQMLWCANFQELQVGGHVTAWRFDGIEWSAGRGWAFDTDHRSGPYLRLGVGARF